MKNLKPISIMLLVIALVFTFIGTVSAQTSLSNTVFVASEPDSQGNFTLSLNIYNAKFNTFQFVLRYDKTTVVPINSKGEETANFFNFATKSKDAEKIITVGTSIDNSKELIDFTGYMSPGSVITTDGLPAINGYANIGNSGLKVFEFSFKKIGNADVIIEIASQNNLEPYSKFLPAGAVLLDAGESLPMSVKFSLPLSVGENSSTKPTRPETSQTMTKQERLQKTIAIQIGNYGAAADGILIHIDSDNKDVHPYMDENDRTMIPLRFISEQLGASAYWNEKEKKIKIVSGNKTIIMTIGSKAYKINDVLATMDTAPVIKEGWNRTMVPLRFVTEALGMAVEWDREHSLVVITEPDIPWQLNRQAEQEATDSILFVISPGKRNII